MSTSRKWFVYVNERQYGPYSDQQLSQLAHQAKIAPDTLVRPDGGEEWKESRQVKGLWAASEPQPNAYLDTSVSANSAGTKSKLVKAVIWVVAFVAVIQIAKFTGRTLGEREAKAQNEAKLDVITNRTADAMLAEMRKDLPLRVGDHLIWKTVERIGKRYELTYTLAGGSKLDRSTLNQLHDELRENMLTGFRDFMTQFNDPKLGPRPDASWRFRVDDENGQHLFNIDLNASEFSR